MFMIETQHGTTSRIRKLKIIIVYLVIHCVPIKFGLYFHFIKISKLKFNCFVFFISE